MFVIFQFLYFSTKIKKHVNFQVGTMVHCKFANRTIMCKFLIQNKVTLSTIMYLEAHVRSKHCTYEKPHGEIQQMFPQQSVSTNRGSQIKTCFFVDTRNVFPQGNSFSVALPLLNVYLWAAWLPCMALHYCLNRSDIQCVVSGVALAAAERQKTSWRACSCRPVSKAELLHECRFRCRQTL